MILRWVWEQRPSCLRPVGGCIQGIVLKSLHLCSAELRFFLQDHLKGSSNRQKLNKFSMRLESRNWRVYLNISRPQHKDTLEIRSLALFINGSSIFVPLLFCWQVIEIWQRGWLMCLPHFLLLLLESRHLGNCC